MSIQVTWDTARCCHSAQCVKALPQVFMVQDGRFVIQPDAAPEDAVRAAVAACPSQALAVNR